MYTIKENLIRDYISNINFRNDDWSLYKIKEDMHKFLGEDPGVDVFYKKDVSINEVSGTSTEVDFVHKIQIVFTDTDDKFNKVEFIISDKI